MSVPLSLGCFLLALQVASSATSCDCFSDPTQMCCMDWTYEYAANDVTSLCNTMTMFACGIDSYCHKNSHTDQYCDSFSILADICVVDHMSGMSGCSNYTRLCSNVATSMVPQCNQSIAMPNVLTTSSSKSAIKSLCSSMSMGQCQQCVVPSTGATCDCKSLSSTCIVKSTASLLSVLSDVCLEMPMSDCNGFTQMCSTAGSDFDAVCKGSSGGESSKLCNGQGTVMFMNGFKGSFKEDDACVSFLFTSWVMDTRIKLAFGVIGTFALAVCQSLISLAIKRIVHCGRSRACVWESIVLSRWRRRITLWPV